MSTKNKKCCPNCSQLFNFKSVSSKENNDNIPLSLKCGHSICEKCIKILVKFEEPINCKICHQDMEVSANDRKLLAENKLKIYYLFPVNVYVLGELSLELLLTNTQVKSKDDDCFLNLTALIEKTEISQGHCLECSNPTTQMCQQCETILCVTCFNKSHKNFITFRNHMLQNIEPKLRMNNCKVHTEKALDYFCKDCSHSICMDCLVIGGEKSCKNHNLVSTQEVNEQLLEELVELSPQVDAIFKRLTKTAVDIGHMLYNIENDTESSDLGQVESEIEQHFSKLTSIIQTQKLELMNKITAMKNEEKKSLQDAKKQLAGSIKKSKSVLNAMKKSLSVEKIKQANMSMLLDDAKKVVNSPWYLQQNRNDINVVVNEELCNLVSDYICLKGDRSGTYKLLTTAEIDPTVEIPAPPLAPVYPPELPKDVRKQIEKKPIVEKDKKKSQTFYKAAPTYRSKSASVSSLNSQNSESSYKSSGNYRDDDVYKPVHHVSPYQENQEPKQLCAGGQELVYISHIVTPHNFFVQQVSYIAKVEELIKEFRNAVSLPTPSISHVAEGKLYLVFNKADKLWQRCQVISIDRKDVNKCLFHVFCIDFGSTEVVPIDKLRLLPPARAQSLFPLAINCSLFNCMPLAGSWTSDDAILMQNITNNKQAVMYIHQIRTTSNWNLSVECDLTTFEGGVNLAQALVFHGRARLPNPKIPYRKIITAANKPKLFISNSDFKPKTSEEVYITHIVSPDHFYVRKHHLQVVYEKLCQELDQNYSLSINKGNIYLPEIDMVCVVNLEKYDVPSANTSEGRAAWARAVVTELPGRSRVRLLLPDCGASVLAHWSALRHINTNFTTQQALATECHLAGVTPLNKIWSPTSVVLLQTFRDRLLELHVNDNRNRSLAVTLYDKTEHEKVVCINTEMVKCKFAVTIGMFTYNKHIDDLEEHVVTNISPLEKVKSPDRSKSTKIKILKKEKLPERNDKENYLQAKDKGPLRLEAKILCYQSPSLIYVSLVHQQKTFSSLFENIQKFYSTKKIQSKDNWKIGDKCCTICQESQTWRRATILNLEGNYAKVFYLDLACIETVLVSDLRELTETFAAIGYAAMKCHLCGVMPADGDEWPSITKEYLKDLLDAYKRVFITKIGDFKDMSMPVEMWVYHTTQGTALEPNVSEWRCLNKKIIEQGLGIPDRTLQINTPTNEADGEKENTLSFLNVTGSVEEWLQLEPMPIKPMTIESESQSSKSSPSVECQINYKENEKNKHETVFISNWIPPEPLQSREFTGVPTYVDNDGIIYLHDVSQQDTLDLIRKALDVRFKNPDPKAKYASWSVGEPCIALYYLDNKFYRGRILEVNKETSTCIVHYIDYGNEESCSFANLRKSIALYQIPTQATKCVLARIQPVENYWDRQTLDYMHKSIVEKNCFVRVTGDPIDEIHPIELKYDKLWINDHLVEFEMAKYSDGSKAVIRKFAPINSTQDEVHSTVTESDSGPDYIVEDHDADVSSSHDSYCMEALEGKNWNTLIQEDIEKKSFNGKYLTYTKNEDENFICNITVINDFNLLELYVLHSDEKVQLKYEKMFDKLQETASGMPELDGIFENKACVALYEDDGRWYRASILQYSEDTNTIKVRYVDYGNIEVISMSLVREIDKEFTKLPPLTLSASLKDIEINPKIDMSVLTEIFKNTFLDKGPFHAQVIDYENGKPSVVLRNENGDLVYKSLIENEIFLSSIQ